MRDKFNKEAILEHQMSVQQGKIEELVCRWMTDSFVCCLSSSQKQRQQTAVQKSDIKNDFLNPDSKIR